MKKVVFSLLSAILMIGLLFNPAAAAPSPSGRASELCGSAYTVQHLDNLSKIASLCETTVADILALNPQITNPNLIYSGQVLRLTGGAVRYATTYTVQSGDTLQEIASLFGTTAWAIWQVNPDLWDNSSIYAQQVLNIPEGGTYTPTSSGAQVSLSTTRAESGDRVTVYVSSFPANAPIDYRLGEEDEEYSLAFDGTVGSNGTTSLTITLPSDADYGEYWVVQVTTTGQRDGVVETSPRIFIDN